MKPAHAPAPWSYEASGKPGGNGDLNIYVTDKNGRKIAAVWGKRGEKEFTASMLIAAPDLYEALKSLLPILDNDGPLPAVYRDAGVLAEKAIRLADGEGE